MGTTMGTARDGEQGDNGILAAARAYTRRGWRVVPVRPGEKGVAIVRWPEMRLDEEDLPKWFGQIGVNIQHNIGILTGEPSGGLMDVDCDAPEAALAALELLPETDRISGRASAPTSHYWYRIDGELPATTKWADVAAALSRPSATLPDAGRATATIVPGGDGSGSPPSLGEGLGERAVAPRSMLIELRSTGCQTIAPPSVHPSGEIVRWERAGEPGVVTGSALLRAVARVASAALLIRHWPGEGQRDEAAKDLAGVLLRGGWDADETDRFVMLVARLAGDEEWRKRAKARTTARKLAEGSLVTGGTALAGRLTGNAGAGERVVAQARAWLGLSHLSGLGGARGASYGQNASYGQYQEMATTDTLATTDEGGGWFVSGDAVVETRVNWLWEGRIPLGAITLLDGDPGLGKSLLTIDLAARVTTGRGMPLGAPGMEGAEGGAGVVLLSAEDNISATIVPRLRLAATNMARVGFICGVPEEDAVTGRTLQRAFVLPHDIPWLEMAIQRKAARLVVIDPLMSFLDGAVNSWRDQDVRAALAPLAALAERTGVAILILRHLNKASGSSALYRGGGSIGIIGAARSGLLVAKHPDNPDRERVLTSIKSNLGPPMPSLRYQLTAILREVEGLEEDGIEHLKHVPVVEWLGECDLDATALLAATPTGGQAAEANPTKVEAAKKWLREALADGPHLKDDIEQAAEAAGIASRTLRRAREQLDIRDERAGYGSAMRTHWRLEQAAGSLPVTTIQGMPAPHPPVVANPSSYGQPGILATIEPVGQNCAPATDIDPQPSTRCPATGGPHEYAQFRHADGRLRCVECGEAAP